MLNDWVYCVKLKRKNSYVVRVRFKVKWLFLIIIVILLELILLIILCSGGVLEG